LWQAGQVVRPTIFAYAGGAPAFRALAADFHARCLAHPVLEHPFSHTGNPEHVQRLADYWGEVFGGPPVFSESYGGHSAMLQMHARQGAQSDLGEMFLAVFDDAVAASDLPDDPELRAVLHDYMVTATTEVMAYSPEDSVVPPGLPLPRWGWDGPAS
jgi:hemoglobin